MDLSKKSKKELVGLYVDVEFGDLKKITKAGMIEKIKEVSGAVSPQDDVLVEEKVEDSPQEDSLVEEKVEDVPSIGEMSLREREVYRNNLMGKERLKGLKVVVKARPKLNNEPSSEEANS